MGFAGQIRHKTFANPPPTGFFAPPLDAATGPGQLFPIEETATGANHPIVKMSARTGKAITRWPGMGGNSPAVEQRRREVGRQD